MTGAAAAAETAVAAALDGRLVRPAAVIAGAADELAAATPTVTVRAAGARSDEWRDIVDIDITVLVAAEASPAAQWHTLRDEIDSAVAAVRTHLADGPTRWLGDGAPLEWRVDSSDTVDARQIASATLAVAVAVDRAAVTRRIAATEQTVVDALDAAGSAVPPWGVTCDRPPAVTTRWAGTSAGDPASDDIAVVVTAPLGSGAIAGHADDVRRVLDRAAGIVVIGRTDIDHAGIGPGASAAHETAQMTAAVLRVSGDDA